MGTGATSVVLWNLDTGDSTVIQDSHDYFLRSIAYSPDGEMALIGSQQFELSGDGTPITGAGDLTLWDMTTYELIRQ